MMHIHQILNHLNPQNRLQVPSSFFQSLPFQFLAGICHSGCQIFRCSPLFSLLLYQQPFVHTYPTCQQDFQLQFYSQIFSHRFSIFLCCLEVGSLLNLVLKEKQLYEKFYGCNIFHSNR